MSMAMKDRQRWQPEEDAILNAYVTQYGPHDWNLISERMGQPLDRDPKSCHERWKNYLKPGIKRGPLSEEEQQLVIKLQTKYGNKWKRIAAEVPGRTAKRLGKWWEVYKERMLKEKRKYPFGQENTITDGLPALLPSFSGPFILPELSHQNVTAFSTSTSPRSDNGFNMSGSNISTSIHVSVSENLGGRPSAGEPTGNASVLTTDDEPLLTLGLRSTKSDKRCAAEFVATSVPKWLSLPSVMPRLDSTTESSSNNSEVICLKENMNISPMDVLKDLKDSYDDWTLQKKKSSLKLKELKQQLELEKRDKKRQKMEEVEAKMKALKAEEKLYMDKLEHDYTELVSNLEVDSEMKDNKLMEAWALKYEQLVRVMNQQQQSSIHGPLFEAINSRGIDNVA